MANAYQTTIKNACKDGGLLDALLAIQKRDGYVTEEGLTALAAYVGKSPAELYDTASFYSMLRFTPPAKKEIRVCRGTACHSADNAALVAALETATGLKIGQSNEDYGLDWIECLGQCQAAPNLLINGKLYTNVDPAKITKLLGGDK
ncbi:MAG: NAD(P)H-dependent oxidoreductase subunit E [Oscillospiraceae bacterium]|nr:NAD(P)H-dependent oxidoreductase subunit E [Oscillospiraceae bacterium]